MLFQISNLCKNIKTAKSNTAVVQQGVPYHNCRLQQTTSNSGSISWKTLLMSKHRPCSLNHSLDKHQPGSRRRSVDGLIDGLRHDFPKLLTSHSGQNSQTEFRADFCSFKCLFKKSLLSSCIYILIHSVCLIFQLCFWFFSENFINIWIFSGSNHFSSFPPCSIWRNNHLKLFYTCVSFSFFGTLGLWKPHIPGKTAVQTP